MVGKSGMRGLPLRHPNSTHTAHGQSPLDNACGGSEGGGEDLRVAYVHKSLLRGAGNPLVATKLDNTAMELADKRDEMQAWLDWEALPPEDRDPPSLAKLAVHLGIGMTTLQGWRRDPRHGRARQGRVAAQAAGHMPAIVERLAHIALESQPREALPAARLLRDIILDDRGDQDKVAEAFTQDPSYMTTDQLRDVADALSSAADEVDAQTPAAIEL